jgi:hypothetical protein
MVIYFWITTVIFAILAMLIIKELLDYSESEHFLVLLAVVGLWLLVSVAPSNLFSTKSKEEKVPVENYEIIKGSHTRIIELDKTKITGTESNTRIILEKQFEINKIDSMEFQVVKKIGINMWDNVSDESFEIKYK